jgi:hypothetical protein
MMYMSPRRILITAAASVLLLSARAFSAILATDVNAMPGFKGTENFDTAAPPPLLLSLKANVDYAVYAPGMFNLSFPGSDPSGGSHYVYAYQVLSTGTAASRDPAFLSVGFDPGDNAVNIGFVQGFGSDPIPSFIPVGGGPDFTSATWNFNPAIPDGAASDILFYTSRQGPEYHTSSVQGGGLTHESQPGRLNQTGLPSPAPVPEPGTALAALGTVAALLIRRRASK